MARGRAGSSSDAPRRLPRGRHALAPEEVLRDQRQRLLAAIPGAVAERGYEATSVADVVRRAAVSRNAFYKNFRDKQDCFAAAHEVAHERLLALLEEHCDPDTALEARVENALGAALGSLAGDPDTARLLFVEAPSSAGEEVALRYHEWLRRYGELLHSAAPPAAAMVPAEIDEVIVGGIASRIASEVLLGKAAHLRKLTEPLTNYVLAFYGAVQADSRSGGLVALKAEQPPEHRAERRRQAGA